MPDRDSAAAIRTPVIETLVHQHLARRGPGDHVTVCASPHGIASYMAGRPDAAIREVRHEQNALVVRADHAEFGTLLSVLGGPTTVEVALHDTVEQRDAYRDACAEVDVENREQALAAIQQASIAMLRELGVEVTDPEPEPDDEDEDEDEGGEPR